MKINFNIFRRSQFWFTLLALLFTVCFCFLIILFYLNTSPYSAINLLLGTLKNKELVYDTSNLYEYSEPVSHLHTVKRFVDLIGNPDLINDSASTIGVDVKSAFLQYVSLAEDFSNISNLITSWYDKYLAFNDRKLYLFQVKNGKIFMKSLDVPDIDRIEYAYIFKSGNIMFCDNQNAYYSHDNLFSYQKSELLDIDGKAYVPNKYGNFFSLAVDGIQTIDGKEIRVWGNYSNYGVWKPGKERSEQLQVWYTIDEGKTIKSAYKFTHSEPKLLARHIHAVNMCPWDNSFWLQTGDGLNECHWLQGKYDWDEDLWNWRLIASGDEMSYYKSTGFAFYDNYVFWADDSSDPSKHGIWKTPYTNLISSKIDINQFEKSLSTNKEFGLFAGNEKGFLIASQYFKSPDSKYKIFVSRDGGVNWMSINTTYQIINLIPPNQHGVILGNYFINQETLEAVHQWDWKPSIFVNSYLDERIIIKR